MKQILRRCHNQSIFCQKHILLVHNTNHRKKTLGNIFLNEQHTYIKFGVSGGRINYEILISLVWVNAGKLENEIRDVDLQTGKK